MIKAKDKRVSAEALEALKAGKGADAANEAAREGVEEADGAPTADGEGWHDFIDEQKREYKGLLAKQAMPEPNAPLAAMPPPFEQVSLCARGPCRYFFRVVVPVRMKMYDEKAPGGVRPGMATVRRCLVGAVKLDSDDPIVVSTMRHLGTEAPYGVQECSHWSPQSNHEIELLTIRRVEAKEREDEARQLREARDEQERQAERARTDAPTEDPDADADSAPEPDLAAPPTPFEMHAVPAREEPPTEDEND